jgi:hypothetical protein
LEFETFNPIINVGGLFSIILLIVGEIVVLSIIILLLKCLEKIAPNLKSKGKEQINEYIEQKFQIEFKLNREVR